MGKPANGYQDVTGIDILSKPARGAAFNHYPKTFSGELAPVTGEFGSHKAWFRAGKGKRRDRFATISSLKMAKELSVTVPKQDLDGLPAPDGALARANSGDGATMEGSVGSAQGQGLTSSSGRWGAVGDPSRTSDIQSGIAVELGGGSGPLKPNFTSSFESESDSPPWFRPGSSSGQRLRLVGISSPVDEPGFNGLDEDSSDGSQLTSSKSGRSWVVKRVNSPSEKARNSSPRNDSGDSFVSDGSDPKGLDYKRSASFNRKAVPENISVHKGPGGPLPDNWTPANSIKGPPKRPTKTEKPPKTEKLRPSPKFAKHAYMLHENSAITGDFLGLMSELSKEAEEMGGRGAEGKGNGSLEGNGSPSGSSSGRSSRGAWSWRKMGWKRSSTTKGRQEEASENLDQRLDKAKATLSAYQDRSPLEDAAELPEEIIPDVDVEELVLTDLPRELALPSASPLRSPLRRDRLSVAEPFGKLMDDDDMSRASGDEDRSQHGPGERSLLSILGGTPATAHESESSLSSLPQQGEGSASSLLKELERMRKKAEVAEMARIAAEEKVLKALAEADRSLRDMEVAKKKREIENASKLELATQGASMAIRQAEAARTVAMAEARNTEEALTQAAKTWAALEAEARKRQEREEQAAVDERSRANLKHYRQYTWEELQAATDNFAPGRKVGEGGFGTVFSGVLHHTPVAVKVLKNTEGLRAAYEFQQEVDVLGEIHHPHMVMLLGCCPERFCLVYEFMGNGSLEDRLLCLGGSPPLPWFVRLRICAEVASALLVLHTRPVPIVHRDLKPANVLLDKNLVAKLGDVGLARIMPDLNGDHTYMRDSKPVGTFAYVDPEFQRTGEFGPKSDVYAFGIMLLDVLTGRKPHVYEGVEEAVEEGAVEKLGSFLDPSAGAWPVSLAMEVARLAVRCSEMRRKKRPDLVSEVMPQLDKIRTFALAAEDESRRRGAASPAPNCLFCPITQEIMRYPVLAADGHTYEHKAIEQWLHGSDRSPMTDQKLPHKELVPNLAVRTMISEWKEAQGPPTPAAHAPSALTDQVSLSAVPIGNAAKQVGGG